VGFGAAASPGNARRQKVKSLKHQLQHQMQDELRFLPERLVRFVVSPAGEGANLFHWS
jgi:hypothetical protein